MRLGTLPVPVARRLLPVALRFWVAVGARGPPGATFGRFLSILGRFSEVRALLSVTFFATFAKNGKVAFVWPWPHETRVGTFKKRPKIDEKAIEKRKGNFFGVKTLQVRVFFAQGSLPGVAGSDLGTSQGLRGGSFGRPLRSPGASGRRCCKLGGALGAPGVPREAPWSDFGSILDAMAASQERFWDDFVINFGCLGRRFRT